MRWEVVFHSDFEGEFDNLSEAVRDAIFAKAVLLEREGPSLGRPHADVLKGSRHPQMKELRCKVGAGVWRIAFAFDPERKGVLLVAGDKVGINKRRFYRQLIAKADRRFDQHLAAHESETRRRI